VIDIATLTGACVIALGHHASGLFSNEDSLAREITMPRKSHLTGLAHPMWDDYQEQLKSNFADIAQHRRRSGAASRQPVSVAFHKKFSWAHLDIAGTAWKSARTKALPDVRSAADSFPAKTREG